MSEKSFTTTTSFITSNGDMMDKPPLSSDSSIDSGCNSSTSDSIKSNQHYSSTANHATACTMTNQQYQNGTRSNLLMLPMQPSVPPPPPPPLPPLQMQDELRVSNDAYNNQAAIYHRLSDQASNGNGNSNGNNIYGTYASSCSTSIGTNPSQLPSRVQTKQDSPAKQQVSPSSQTFQQTVINKRSSTSSLESASSVPLIPMNVKGMLLHGLPSEEVMRNWLSSIKCDEHIDNFIHHGYDMHLVTRMTPQDLAAIGCKSPALRKKLLTEIKKLNLDYDVPNLGKTMDLEKWLESLKLTQYFTTLMSEGYDTVDKACQLTWEDLEEIGVTKLGHQKRLLMAIDKIRKLDKQQEENLNDSAIYDVHPNHRVSLNGALDTRTGTIGRVRSGLFQTRSGANLDHRGLPVATVMPALKHVASPMVNAGIQQQITTRNDHQAFNGAQTATINEASSNKNNLPKEYQIYDTTNHGVESLYLNDLNSTMKRNRPLPPVRTNSLKVPNCDGSNDSQMIYATNGMNYNTNSTSFLRTPKLGTLTATTNKMLTSGGHIQTLCVEQTTTNRSMFSPVREAPLPPTQLHQQIMQSSIPERIEEEPTFPSTSVGGMQNGYTVSLGNDSNGTFMNAPQLASSDEFPPAPPCQ